MDLTKLNTHTMKLLEAAQNLMHEASHVESLAKKLAKSSVLSMQDPLVMALTVFVMACFIGYFVVWRVTPALHSPLMAITNAISSVIIVGAIMAMSPKATFLTLLFAFLAIVLSTINIVGGFMVTHRMLHMFASSRKNKK